MLAVHRNFLRRIHCKRETTIEFNFFIRFHRHRTFFSRFFPCKSPLLSSLTPFSVVLCRFIHARVRERSTHVLAHSQIVSNGNSYSNPRFGGSMSVSMCYSYSTKPPTRSLRRRISRRKKLAAKPLLDETQFQLVVSQLPPRFTPEELHNVIVQQENPMVCFELFNWATQQHRFKHDLCTYHITIKKLGLAKLYDEMDNIVNQVLALRHVGNEALYNSMIYYFAEARKLTRAVNIFKHMRNSRNLECRPSIRTYHILFMALLSRRSNTYINHVYMETIRCLFKQMVDDRIEPDVFALNCMIKGYVLSLHVNDALRIFHQMSVVYNCQPNAYSYDYLIHGLCAQGRTVNARGMCEEMKVKGFVPSSKSYNSLVNALAIGREVEEAVGYLWEMIDKQKSVDLITYRTVLEEMCRVRKAGEAMRLLRTLQEKRLVNEDTYKQLICALHD